jgi:hypothetical protein
MARITNHYVEEVVDYATGEIVSNVKRYTYKTNGKRFAMMQLDDNWNRKIKAMDVYVLFELIKYDNQHTMHINIDKSLRENLCKNLDISEAQITKSLSNMVKENILKRVSRGTYMINPSTVWIGNTQKQEEKQEIYNSL